MTENETREFKKTTGEISEGIVSIVSILNKHQHGELFFGIKKDGTYIDNMKLSDKKISEFKLEDNDYISVKIGIKEEAKNIGGISIFGKSFGDYPQDIVMKLEYDKIKE